MAKRDHVWDNPGGTPGMPICKIERDSEAWKTLVAALSSDARYIRISAAYGDLTVKEAEQTWSPPLNVEAE